jgi:branched-chain amino acid aminotransferase
MAARAARRACGALRSMSDILAIEPDEAQTATDAMARIHRNPGFCKFRTDHSVVVEWDERTGWSRRPAGPHDPIEMDPAALVFHYGQAVFEGLKAFRRTDGSAALFRPADHARRLQRSARRLAMAEMPADLFVAACADLVAADDAWLPGGTGQSLYLRPILLATETELALRPSRRYRCTFMAYPADPCFGREFLPLSVMVGRHWARAVRGGTGEAKCAGNYAASLLAKQAAIASGYDEVLWLDGVDRRWVEELTTMNVFFVWRAEDGGPAITTPPGQGTIVRGITRDSLLTLAHGLGFAAGEEPTDIDTALSAARSGRLAEMFACGTAGVVVPVGRLGADGQDLVIGDGNEGPMTALLRRTLLDAQHGVEPDVHDWLVAVDRQR